MDTTKIYNDNFSKVKHYVLQNNGSIDDAYDVFQDAVSIAWYNYKTGKYDSSKGNIDAYIITIAKNKWIDQLRKNKNNTLQYTENLIDYTEENLDNYEETENKIKKLLFTFQQIGDKCKEILQLYYYQKQRLEIIAKKFDTNTNVIKTQKNRCMKKLKELMYANR